MDRKQTSQATTGALLIVLGLIFLFDRLEVTHGLDIGKLWPLLLLVIGFGQMLGSHEAARKDRSDERVVSGVQVGVIHGDGRRRSGDGIWLIATGAIFLLHNFHVMSIRQSWPLFIVVTGLAIIMSSRGSRNGPSTDVRQGDR